ncbi:MAG TPA: hypothetical protein VGY56_09260 [Verrucomicrobiae bacterium]|nr:hypothetical protein [Verrucomicrobiae bacterium]
MDDTSFDLLCKGLPPNEAKLFRKILKEWCDGDEDSFPVQLALLTKAQWRAAALISNAINESGKLIEIHLVECRQQTAAIVKNLSAAAAGSADELKGIVKIHTEAVNTASVSIRNQLWEAEEAAKQIRNSLSSGISEWRKARDDFAAERLKLEKERKELAARIQWRDWLWAGLTLFGIMAIGIIIGFWLRGKFH